MVEILMSTYNGERFLHEQLDTILAQQYNDWRLVVRDDGSIDSTRSILAQYREKYADKITIISDDEHLGVIGSFEKLLQLSTADYVMFADQDDVWHSDKIAEEMALICKLENRHSADIPIAIHSDLRVVDEHLCEMAPSFWAQCNIRPQLLDNHPAWLGFCNSVTGATLLLNRKGREIVLPFPQNIAMHDAYIAVKIAREGVLDYVDKQLVDYRQHGKNIVGVTSYQFNILDKVQNLKATYNQIVSARKFYPFLYKNKCHFWREKIAYFAALHLKKGWIK